MNPSRRRSFVILHLVALKEYRHYDHVSQPPLAVEHWRYVAGAAEQSAVYFQAGWWIRRRTAWRHCAMMARCIGLLPLVISNTFYHYRISATDSGSKRWRLSRCRCLMSFHDAGYCRGSSAQIACRFARADAGDGHRLCFEGERMKTIFPGRNAAHMVVALHCSSPQPRDKRDGVFICHASWSRVALRQPDRCRYR